ncbi:MAG: NADPH-dependent F420 reductase [Chloroflexi bacterium]|nr:NADPH-dependent F420 reductase [Chloroflexota bacterium]
MSRKQTIGLIGGTGPEGKGLAVRFALAGHDIVIGSRDAGRASSAATAIGSIIDGRRGAGLDTSPTTGKVTGDMNKAAARAGDIVILAVPYAGQAATVEELRPKLDGKIVINVISPLKFAHGRATAAPPPAGSAAEEAAALAPTARWVAGFHTLPAGELADPESDMNTDVLICSDDEDAKKTVMEMVGGIAGARPVDAGGLESARYLEAATALLITINKIYRAHGSLKIVGI